MSFDDRFVFLKEDNGNNNTNTSSKGSPSQCRLPGVQPSLKKAIKIFGRLKPPLDPRTPTCPYQVSPKNNDGGPSDDLLILNPNGEDYDGSSFGNNVNLAAGLFHYRYKFRFSKIFETTATQAEVFEEMCRPVLERSLEGYNSTIFAYGQTGSGKTYTMTGGKHKKDKRGIIPRALSYIFEKFNSFEEEGHLASAFCSYLEIYNENGRDLLQAAYSTGKTEDIKNVQLFEDAQQQFHMKNLSVHQVTSEEEAVKLLYLGDHNRVIAETPMNESSTRSHCIFTIYLNIRQRNSSTVKRSKIHLVDLAGSERLAHSNTKGQLFSDSCNINLALHYLEHVIVALGESNRSHIPYRNSMMTSILKDSLGGNCMTAMVATLSLEYRNVLETIQTCRFSQRVALVTNTATPNEETDTALLISQLKKENKRLKGIISKTTIKKADKDSEPLTSQEVAECLLLVENFLSDPDEETIIPVVPDMRMVQTCFKCLKKAVEELKMTSSSNCSGATSMTGFSERNELDIPNYNPKSDDFPYEEYTPRRKLLKCLRIRDDDIESFRHILDSLREKVKCKAPSKNSRSRIAPVPLSSLPSPRRSRSRSNDSKPSRARITSSDISDEDSDDDHLSRITLTLGKSPPEFENNNEMEFKCKLVNSDPSGLLTEKFSESKKNALETFTKSYKGYDEMQTIQDNLSWKRTELESRENLLRRNQAHLKQLKMDMVTSKDAGREEDIFLREAIESTTRSVSMQEYQLSKGQEEMKQIEENLKGLRSQLMNDFEKHWQSLKNFKMKAGIPRVSFSNVLLQPSASELAQQQQQRSSRDSPSSVSNSATKGILKKPEPPEKPANKEFESRIPVKSVKRVYQFIPLEN